MNSKTKIYLLLIVIFTILFGISALFNHINPWIGILSLFLFLGIFIHKGKNIIEWIMVKPKKQNTKTKNKKSKNEKL